MPAHKYRFLLLGKQPSVRSPMPVSVTSSKVCKASWQHSNVSMSGFLIVPPPQVNRWHSWKTLKARRSLAPKHGRRFQRLWRRAEVHCSVAGCIGAGSQVTSPVQSPRTQVHTKHMRYRQTSRQWTQASGWYASQMHLFWTLESQCPWKTEQTQVNPGGFFRKKAGRQLLLQIPLPGNNTLYFWNEGTTKGEKAMPTNMHLLFYLCKAPTPSSPQLPVVAGNQRTHF